MVQTFFNFLHHLLLEFLEEERKKIWGRLTELEGDVKNLEEELQKKTTDYEQAAKEASDRAVEFKISTEQDKNIVAENLAEATTKLEELRASYNLFVENKTKLDELYNSSNERNAETKILHDVVSDLAEIAKNKAVELDKIFETKPVIDEKLVKLNEVFTRADDYDTKIKTLNNSIGERKKEIDELYYEIIGYKETDEDTGKETEVKGMKDELQNSFKEVKSKLETLEKETTEFRETTIEEYTKFTEEKEASYKENFEKWNAEHNSIVEKIEKLLPRALTAGLSFAYEEKKKDEVKESGKHARNFYRAIGGLILISLIPVTISIVSIFKETPLDTVLFRIPRLVLALLPLYIPILWVAYYSNRKMNLSKRLIEEYSHKEVLSKTFEGLAKQIAGIEDKNISADLRNKLLYNILEVNSENPGKLISDYDKSDHPIMDALDKSVQLGNAVNKLSKFPGLPKLMDVLVKRSEANINKVGQKAKEGLEALEKKSEVNGKVVAADEEE